MWQRSGANLFAIVVLTIVVLEAAAMITLAAAFLLHTAARVPYEDLHLALLVALGVIVGSVVLLASYILGYHVYAKAREHRRQEAVRAWAVWWQGLLQYTRRDVEGPLPREAIEAFLELRETLPPEENERLGVLGERYQLAALLSRRLATRKSSRRLEALQDLARARLPGVLPAIAGGMADQDPVIRRHALRAAARTLARVPAEVNGPEIEAFVRALREVDLPVPLLSESLHLLEEAAEQVVGPILTDPRMPPRVLRAALIAVGRRKLQSLAQDVVPYCSHMESEVRAAAMQAVAGMGLLPPGTEAAVLANVDDEKPFVRIHAVRAAALLPVEKAVDLLWKRLGDPSWWVRLATAETLGEMGVVGRSSLEQAADDHPDRYARDMARQALSDLRWRTAA